MCAAQRVDAERLSPSQLVPCPGSAALLRAPQLSSGSSSSSSSGRCSFYHLKSADMLEFVIVFILKGTEFQRLDSGDCCSLNSSSFSGKRIQVQGRCSTDPKKPEEDRTQSSPVRDLVPAEPRPGFSPVMDSSGLESEGPR
ncbi:uncharacterized protein V6R79_015342 [Siganus canaliculatus]